MWGKIIIPMYRLWLHSLYGLYGPWCPLSPKRLINLISLCLLGEWFVAKRGVQQGAPFSMKLFQAFVNGILLNLRGSQQGITTGDIDLTCPTFADDIAMIALYKSSLNHLLSLAYDYSKKWRFQFNLDKCEAMIFGKDHQPSKPIIAGETEFQSEYLANILVSACAIIRQNIWYGMWAYWCRQSRVPCCQRFRKSASASHPGSVF